MRKNALWIAIAGALAFPASPSAQAGASVELRLDLPVVLPQLVVVSPGVQVVTDLDEEVFLLDGFYWVRHDGGWYRSRSHRGGWVLVPARGVPARLVKIPPGKYRRYRPEKAKAYGDRDQDRGRDHEKHGKKRGRKHGRGD